MHKLAVFSYITQPSCRARYRCDGTTEYSHSRSCRQDHRIEDNVICRTASSLKNGLISKSNVKTQENAARKGYARPDTGY